MTVTYSFWYRLEILKVAQKTPKSKKIPLFREFCFVDVAESFSKIVVFPLEKYAQTIHDLRVLRGSIHFLQKTRFFLSINT